MVVPCVFLRNADFPPAFHIYSFNLLCFMKLCMLCIIQVLVYN